MFTIYQFDLQFYQLLRKFLAGMKLFGFALHKTYVKKGYSKR